MFVLSWLFCDQSKERVDLSWISHSPASTKERDKRKAGLSVPEELFTQVNQRVRDKKAAEAMGSCLRPGRDTAMEAGDTRACPRAKRIFWHLWVAAYHCECFRHHVLFPCIQEAAWRQGRTWEVSCFVQTLTGH